MATSRDDFVIAIRSALLRKGTQQRFSLLGLILVSILILILGSLNFKPIYYTQAIIKDIIYRSSFIASLPELDPLKIDHSIAFFLIISGFNFNLKSLAYKNAILIYSSWLKLWKPNQTPNLSDSDIKFSLVSLLWGPLILFSIAFLTRCL